LPEIERELMKSNITAARWELEALSRGATLKIGDTELHFGMVEDWSEFS
jgi:hypothetical protein